jgi:hypothetical protein
MIEVRLSVVVTTSEINVRTTFDGFEVEVATFLLELGCSRWANKDQPAVVPREAALTRLATRSTQL